jgi:hypothetical protein
MKQLAESLGILQSTMSRINSQRDTAKAALAKAREALKQHLLSPDGGDQTTIAALKNQIVSERELITALDDAAETQTALVVAEESRLVDDETKRQRTAASDAILADVAQIERQFAEWLTATRAFATGIGKYASFRTECSGISEFLANAANQVELAASVSIPDLRSAARAVLQGTERPPVMPGTVVKMPAPKPPAPTTERVFLTRNLAWFTPDGETHCAPSLNDCDLPLYVVAKARAIGAAHAMDNDLRRKHHGGKSNAKPALVHCEWLNSDPRAKSNVEPIRHTAFEKHPNVPPPYNIIVPTQPAMENTRALPTKK